jgi:hypothetical protein
MPLGACILCPLDCSLGDAGSSIFHTNTNTFCSRYCTASSISGEFGHITTYFASALYGCSDGIAHHTCCDLGDLANTFYGANHSTLGCRAKLASGLASRMYRP